jgi:hypothetical protein
MTGRLFHALLAATGLLLASGAHAQAPAHAHAGAHAGSMGEHGMLLFGGGDGLFLSHLPMFHRPHDTQVVLQVHLGNREHEEALRRELAARPAVWTIVPEPFELDRLAPTAKHPVRRFHADIVDGHFERGGKTVYTGDEVIVDRVVFDHRLVPTGKAGATLTYRVVDAGPGVQEHFLVHWIDARPGADHVLRVMTPPDTRLPRQVELARGEALSAEPKALEAALPKRGAEWAHVDQSIYLETGDLE